MRGIKEVFIFAILLLLLTQGIAAGQQTQPSTNGPADCSKAKHREILIYNARDPKGAFFSQDIRNVTQEDVVYLQILNSNPLVYEYKVEIQKEDAPEPELLHIYGQGLPNLQLFDLKTKATDVKAQADSTAKEANVAAQAVPMGLQEAPQLPVNAIKANIGKAITQEEADQLTEIQAFFSGEFVQKITTFRKLLDVDLPTTLPKSEGVASLVGLVAALQSHLEKFQLVTLPFTEPAQWQPDIEALRFELARVFDEFSGIDRTIQSASEMFDSERRSEKEFSASVLEKIASAQRIIDKLLTSPKAVLSENEIKQLKDYKEYLVDDKPGTADEKSLLDAVDRGYSAFEDNLDALSKKMTVLQKSFEAVGASIAKVNDAVKSADICRRLGRFEEGKKVTVKITQKDVTATPKPPSASEGITIEGDDLKVTPKGEKSISVAGAKLKVTAGASNITASTAPSNPTTPPGNKASEKEGDEKPKPEDVNPNVLSFTVLKLYHARTNLGFAVSSLENPTFDFRAKDIPAAGTNPATKEITIFKDGDQNIQVLPVFHLGLYLKGRYLFAETDAEDETETVKPSHKYLPYPSFGFSLNDPTKNYFIGGGVDISRGVSVLAGIHFGKVRRLIEGFDVDKAFLIGATETFKIDDVTEESFRKDFYFSLSMDPGALLRVFSSK